jgi:hypothetical protein
VLVDDAATANMLWDGRQPQAESPRALEGPLMFTSSGLGDHLVEPPRRELFERSFEDLDGADVATVQDAFHRHRWPDRPELSVCTSRHDAQTVSHTVVELLPDDVRMTYRAVAGNAAFGPKAECRLARRSDP